MLPGNGQFFVVCISSYTASSEKQDGGPKTTRVLRSRKKENIRFEKENSTRKNSQKNLTGQQNTFITYITGSPSVDLY
jgi:hypothetical protein